MKVAVASSVLPVNPGPGPLRLSPSNEIVPALLLTVPGKNEIPFERKYPPSAMD